MCKFIITDKDEIKIGKTVCDLCFYQKKGTKKSCKKYDCIPEEILKNLKKCPWADHNPNAPW